MTGAVLTTAGVAVVERLQANNRMDKIARGTTRRFIRTVSFFINWHELITRELILVQGRKNESANLFRSTERKIIYSFADYCYNQKRLV
jgi:hypothetical protein